MSETGRIACPWHGAVFDCKNGAIEDGAGLGSLQSYKVSTTLHRTLALRRSPALTLFTQVDIEGTSIFVTADAAALNAYRQPPSVSLNATPAAKAQKVLIVGSGAGSAHAIEGLREAGYEGAIKVLTKENYLPIDRTKLSKGLASDPTKVQLRDADFYKSLEAEFVLNVVRSISSLLARLHDD